jgi:hypothetical protein
MPALALRYIGKVRWIGRAEGGGKGMARVSRYGRPREGQDHGAGTEEQRVAVPDPAVGADDGLRRYPGPSDPVHQKPLTLAAMPAMNEASRPDTKARPVTHAGSERPDRK